MTTPGTASSARTGSGCARMNFPFPPKPPRRLRTGTGSRIICKSILTWRQPWPRFPTMNRCAQPSARVADCACCARSRGNAWRHSFCPPPSRSFKSGKSSHCFANGSESQSTGVASSLWLDSIWPQAKLYNSHFPLPNELLPPAKPGSVPARWDFAPRTCWRPHGRLPTANLIWSSPAVCRWPRRGPN